MLSEVYRICPKCGTSNEVAANFCLKCGSKLSKDDEKPLLEHGGQLSEVLAQMDLTPEEQLAAQKIVIMTGDMPQGYRFQDVVYVNATGVLGQSYKEVMEQLSKHLYSTLYSLGMAGISNLHIFHTVVPDEGVGNHFDLFAYGNGFSVRS